MIVERALRGVAIAIAVLGVIDPSFTADRSVRPTIAVIDTTGDVRDVLGARVAGALANNYRIVRSPTFDAAATVVAGPQLPPAAASITGKVLVVLPVSPDPAVAIARIAAPRRAPFDSRVPLTVSLRVANARDRKITVVLEHNGVAIERVEKTAGADASLDVPLSFVPTARGLAALRVTATIAGVAEAASADTAVDVTDHRWSVLFFDPRPSWSSTFVRRALERDSRFAVRSVVATSTGMLSPSGGAAVSIGSLPALEPFDAIVAGAVDALTPADAAGLNAFARRRGGAVVLLLERADAGPTGALTSVARWREISAATRFPVDATALAPDQPAFEAAEIYTPDPAPEWFRPLATATQSGVTRPVVFEGPLGSGRVIVSGALDAWRYRGVPESSAFDRFWRLTIARAAGMSVPAVDVTADTVVLRPGESTTIRAAVRNVVLAPASGSPVTASVRAIAEGPSGRSVLRLWPDGAPGRFAGELRAPAEAGIYRVSVVSGSDRGEVGILVADESRSPVPDERDLVTAWAGTRDGVVITSVEPGDLRKAVDALVQPGRETTRVWPMRSAWWIVLFSVTTGAEWWLRRRRDLR